MFIIPKFSSLASCLLKHLTYICRGLQERKTISNCAYLNPKNCLLLHSIAFSISFNGSCFQLFRPWALELDIPSSLLPNVQSFKLLPSECVQNLHLNVPVVFSLLNYQASVIIMTCLMACSITPELRHYKSLCTQPALSYILVCLLRPHFCDDIMQCFFPSGLLNPNQAAFCIKHMSTLALFLFAEHVSSR